MKEILGAEGKLGCHKVMRCEIRKNSSELYVQVAIFSMVALILTERLVKY